MIILFILLAVTLYLFFSYVFKHVDTINIKFSNSRNNKIYNILSKNAINTGDNLIQYIYSFKDVKCSFKFDENINFIPSKIEILDNNTLFKIKIYYYGYTDNPSECLQKYVLVPEEEYNNITNFLENNQFNYLGLFILLEK
jgi:hypothetical protein